MNYHMIDYIIRPKNYSIWCLCKNKFDIIKNEHGTYGEFYDFIISLELDENTYNIVMWNIQTDNNEYKKEIIKIIDEIMQKENIKLDEFCFAIVDRL